MLTMSSKKRQTPQIVSPFGSKEYQNEFYATFLFYVENSTDNQSKQWTLDYISTLNKNPEAFSFLPSKKYNPHGVYIKMQKDGIQLPVNIQDLIDTFIGDLEKQNTAKLSKREENKLDKSKKDAIQIHNFLGDLNYFIDCQMETIKNNKTPSADIDNLLKLYDLSGRYHEQTKEMLELTIRDIDLAKNKKDEQLVEAYSYLTKSQLTKYIDFLEKLYNHILTITSSTSSSTTARKPRKKKIKKPEQLVKNITFRVDCNESGLKSTNKTEMIGSRIVFVYNTTTRFLIRYVSTDKFSAKGCTILNVDETLSGKKKIRKPNILFKGINPINLKYMERLWDSIKTKQSSTKNRVNDQCILVSCFK